LAGDVQVGYVAEAHQPDRLLARVGHCVRRPPPQERPVSLSRMTTRWAGDSGWQLHPALAVGAR
jgi:hypothetical protein